MSTEQTLPQIRTFVKGFLANKLGKGNKKRSEEYEQILYKLCSSNKDLYVSTFYSMFAYPTVDAWLADIKANKYEWNSSLFGEYDNNERRTILNITRPLEVQEGIFTCPKCNGKKTHHYSRQIRSADEPATTFITCAEKFCQYRWKIG